MFDIWFPIQKNSANFLGELHISTRNKKLITLEQIGEAKKHLEPGDILLQRRNWYASNIGIPGFWPHAALYIGDPEESSEYFADIFPYEGHEDYLSLIAGRFPAMSSKYRSFDEDGYSYAVIEGKAPGVIIQSVERSFDADYMAAMRPRLGKRISFYPY